MATKQKPPTPAAKPVKAKPSQNVQNIQARQGPGRLANPNRQKYIPPVMSPLEKERYNANMTFSKKEAAALGIPAKGGKVKTEPVVVGNNVVPKVKVTTTAAYKEPSISTPPKRTRIASN